MFRYIIYLFDCDGVLVQSEQLAFVAGCKFINEVLGEKRVDKQYSVNELIHQFVGSNFRNVITELARRHDFLLTKDELESLVVAEEDRVIAKLSEELQPSPGVNAILERLSGRSAMAVVSSSGLRRIRASLMKTGQMHFFPDNCLFSAASSLSIPESKPSPAIYAFSRSSLGVNSQDCLAIEDSRNGVLAAVADGIDVLGYVGCYPTAERTRMTEILKEAGAIKVIQTFTEFDDAVAGLEACRETIGTPSR